MRRAGRRRRRPPRRATRAPRSVISSGSPGPAPTRMTRPVTRLAPRRAGASRSRVRSSAPRPSRTRPAASSRSRACAPPPGALGQIGEDGKRLAAHLAHDPQELRPLGAELLLEALPHEPRDGGGHASGTDRQDEVASTDHGGRRPVTLGDIVNHIDEYASSPCLPGDRGARGAVVGRGHREERSVQVTGAPRPPLDPDTRHTVEPIVDARLHDEHVVRAGGEESLDLPLLDRLGAEHHAAPPGELQHDGVAEAHRVSPSRAWPSPACHP